MGKKQIEGQKFMRYWARIAVRKTIPVHGVNQKIGLVLTSAFPERGKTLNRHVSADEKTRPGLITGLDI
jgi:hypothetical protein